MERLEPRALEEASISGVTAYVTGTMHVEHALSRHPVRPVRPGANRAGMTDTHRADRVHDERSAGPQTQESAPESDFRTELVTHLPHLRAVARALTGHRDRADDLVNDTVLKALSAEAQFQPGTYLKAWLMTILRNHYINGLRRSRIEIETVADIPESVLPSPPNQEHVVEVNEVASALQQMSLEHREILVLVSAA